MKVTDPRHVLMDTAERLFALEGLAVSDRRIAQEAGNANHSAVKYHFGGRDGLLDALLGRHLSDLEAERGARLAASQTLIDDVRALVLPQLSAYALLPTPSWRARFISVVFNTPSEVARVRALGAEAPAAVAIFRSIVTRVQVDPEVLRDRFQLMTYVINAACAEIEARAEATGVGAEWDAAGDFLCDALAGMLAAPISRR